MVDEYAVGVLAYYLFSGMKDYPCKIPLSLTDDRQIFNHLEQAQLEFRQPIWEHYRFSGQIKEIIIGLLKFDDNQRLTAKEALSKVLFNPQNR